MSSDRSVRAIEKPDQRDPQRSTGFAPSGVLIIGVVLLALTVAGLLLVDVLGGGHGDDRPWPSFPVLATAPDASLRGTIAYIAEPEAPRLVESDGPEKVTKYSCAQTVRASGADIRQVLCWPMTDHELASVAWLDDGRLRITGFEDVGERARSVPAWGRVVDVMTGQVSEVSPSDLEQGAFPAPPSTTNSRGETLVTRNEEGSVTVTLERLGGSREVFAVSHPNPGFSIKGDPQWSADDRWFVMFDGGRLLTTIVNDPVITKVLATAVSGSIGQWGATTFAMTDREF